MGREREVRKCRQRDLKMLGCFVINLLNNKTIILLSRGISSDFSRLGIRPRRLSIRRYSARFRRIIVKWMHAGRLESIREA